MESLERNLNSVLQGNQNSFAPLGQMPTASCVVCAGSFNPLHAGHRRLLALGEERTGLPGIFELSITNVDKPPLDLSEIQRRIIQFRLLPYPLILTNQPRYLGKLKIFAPGSSFVMGADTFIRLVDGRYYEKHEPPLAIFESLGATFVVAARRLANGQILTGEQILQTSADASRWGAITHCISAEDFLMDLSSTQIRDAGSLPPEPLTSRVDGK